MKICIVKNKFTTRQKMKQVKTQIDEHLFDEISATGESVYSFLQSAIREKLERQKEKRRIDEFKNEIKKAVELLSKENEKQMKENLDIQLSSTKVARDLHEQAIKKDEEFKEKTLENLKKIVGYIKEK